MPKTPDTHMQEYKQAEYFNSYFSNISSFTLIEDFKESKENALYIGTIEAKDSIHPLQIIVEIPKNFPHRKLIFRTTSLSGYPHLIYDSKQKNSWFCLNTPFGETAEEQLNQELLRLNEWVAKQMRPDLDAFITDQEVIAALRIANAYEWENHDEMEEYSQESMLTFVGKFSKEISNFKEKTGTLNCVKNGSNRFFCFEDKTFAKQKLPYVIVDKIPDNPSDFMSMKEQFGWGEEICNHLLPNLDITKPYESAIHFSLNSIRFSDLQEEEAMAILDEAVKTLIIPDNHRDLVEEHIDSTRAKIREDKGIKKFKFPDCDYSKMTTDEFEDMVSSEDDFNYHHYALHHFALGIILKEKSLFWIFLSTNRYSAEYESTSYNIGIHDFRIKKLSSQDLSRQPAQYVSEKDYFGRGKLSHGVSDKKIGIIGLGAIGSMVAESLVRGGVKELGLWDNDVIEPGNICRTAYTLNDVGNSKVEALYSKLKSISPFCNVKTHGYWNNDGMERLSSFVHGEFYANINYSSQSDAIKPLADYDIIIDCTASNELLHFLSYAVKDKHIISLCITNHAKDLVCVTNKDGNPYELRKVFLSKIEQDTKNFYVEGTGCYSPTFLATNCDIAALANLAIREININMEHDKLLHSTIWSYGRRGVIADKLELYTLEDNPSIRLSISSETLMDGEDMIHATNGIIGYLLGAYGDDGKHILLSHFIEAENAELALNHAFTQSNGIIDYIGDYSYSWEANILNKENLIDILASKAIDEKINTNNPLLAVKNIDESLSFFLYINGVLKPFIKVED